LPHAAQITGDLCDCGVVSREHCLISGQNEGFGGVAGLKNFRSHVLDQDLDLAGVTDKGFSRRKAVGCAEQVNAASDKQRYRGSECSPGDTSEGKTHFMARW
jgi:hypothetical protein